MQEETHFGFQTIEARDKSSRVRGVFDSVASRYDLMNDLMSAGVHRLWKDAMVDQLSLHAPFCHLDMAGGTGDIAERVKKRLKVKGWGEDQWRIYIADINESMLEAGRDRLINKNQADGLFWLAGDAEKLPLPSASVDAYTIAFGIRNVTRIKEALREAKRVLRPGGQFLCLEFSHLSLPFWQKLYDLYSFNVIPWLGEKVTGDRESYDYLVESIRHFPKQNAFLDLLREAGFDRVGYRNFSGGIVALHQAWRL